MVMKVFRPFWSYDLKKTEEWLRSMAISGYHLTDINTKTRQFVFEERSAPQEIHYRIEYRKAKTNNLPGPLQNEGWHSVYNHGRWHVICNEKTADKLKCYPIRDGIIKRNRFIMFLFGGMFLYITLTSFIFIILSGLTVFYFGNSLTIQANPFWITAFTIGITLWALAPYSTIKLYKTNKKFW
ncbi:DUF2812 domain-containing protein [Virgibacillus sp. C22-A2]|uniref:DUF2812 domain-containing protein n=1 Tax=Virgibacillus tibetensis TaxID=3042313 RepID=A0ABU6KKK0_9BACI|nr:DUF2812 domain-containing protein [Virgibacillus sp. C22-A2]